MTKRDEPTVFPASVVEFECPFESPGTWIYKSLEGASVMEAPTQTCDKCKFIYDTWDGGCPRCRGDNKPEHWPRPIPVSERLPERGEIALAYVTGNLGLEPQWMPAEFVMKYGNEFPVWREPHPPGLKRYDDVTHWLPMPPRPDAI